MWLLVSIIGALLALFSTAVMSYLTMATPMGPWIAPTLALLAMLAFKALRYNGAQAMKATALATVTGSVGGILATAFGFSFPTLYFVDKELFTSWMRSPVYFACVVSGLALAAGGFGFWIANRLEDKFIFQDDLAFPIGQMVHKLIIAQQNIRKAYELAAGFVSSLVFSIFQDGCGIVHGFIPKQIVFVPSYSYGVFRVPQLALEMWPMLWAIGIVTGHAIAKPLAVGALVKIFCADTLHAAYFHTHLSIDEFLLAFCSGLVLSSALIGLMDTSKILWRGVGNFIKNPLNQMMAVPAKDKRNYAQREFLVETVVVFGGMIVFLSYFKFSLITQLYLISFTFICAYQIVRIAGEIGMAQLGRFATFVMVPAMFLFSLNYTQIVFIATFVEICGGVATDIMFGRKIGALSGIPSREMKRYQLWGLFSSSVVIGVVFWLLLTSFQLGSPALFAQRAQARALLIASKNFDVTVLIIGFIFGLLLKQLRMSPMLVLGGLIMPLNHSIVLMAGGFTALMFKNKEEWIPFWSGVFAAGSLWALCRAFICR